MSVGRDFLACTDIAIIEKIGLVVGEKSGCDGVQVDCYVLAGLTFQQAASVRVRWDVKKREPAELSLDALADLVAKVTDSSVTLQEE